MRTKEYTITRKCRSFEESELIREQIHNEFIQKMYDKGVFYLKITTQALYDDFEFECIVKITITY